MLVDVRVRFGRIEVEVREGDILLRKLLLDVMKVVVDKVDRWLLSVVVVVFGGLLDNIMRGCDFFLCGLWVYNKWSVSEGLCE